MSQVCNTKAISSSDGYTSGTGVSSVSKLASYCIFSLIVLPILNIVTDEWKVVAHEIGHGFGINNKMFLRIACN